MVPFLRFGNHKFLRQHPCAAGGFFMLVMFVLVVSGVELVKDILSCLIFYIHTEGFLDLKPNCKVTVMRAGENVLLMNIGCDY